MEPMIIRNPELWLWSYKQWRYKPSTAPEGQYPFYANATKRFDEILGSFSSSAFKNAE